MLVALDEATYLGPAEVLNVTATRVELASPKGQIHAVPALPFGYQFVEGDIVLAIGRHEDWYVIGVIKGNGKTILTAPADLEICAPRGCIELNAAAGVRIKAAAVKVVTQRLELAAHVVMEKFGRARRLVRDVLSIRVGRMRTNVDATYQLKAGRIMERAEGDVDIDGQKINLG